VGWCCSGHRSLFFYFLVERVSWLLASRFPQSVKNFWWSSQQPCNSCKKYHSNYMKVSSLLRSMTMKLYTHSLTGLILTTSRVLCSHNANVSHFTFTSKAINLKLYTSLIDNNEWTTFALNEAWKETNIKYWRK